MYYDWNPTMTAKPFRTIVSLLLKQLWNRIEGTDTTLQNSTLEWEIIEGTSTRQAEDA